MNHKSQPSGYRPSAISYGLLLLALGCFALCALAEAVVPAPDGDYGGGNTAEGQNALFSLTTGGFNTAVGFLSLKSNAEASFNTAIGAGTLLSNTADQNTATGAGALLSNTTGFQNTSNGAFVLFSNTTGASNTAIGAGVLLNNLIGDANTAGGAFALANNTAGNNNTALGVAALQDNTTGNNNTAIGFGALFTNISGDNNVALGNFAANQVTTANNVICIGTAGQNEDDSCFIGNIFDKASSGGIAVFVNSSGKLGTTTSSRRFKDSIKRMENASEAVFALKPVTFRYKNDPTHMPQFGLIAEEVADVSPDLVVRDKEGKPYTVRYDAVNAMLLNEFLKEHKKVQEQQATITELKSTVAQQQNEMETVIARIKEQAAQIQKVTSQIEMNRPAPKMVVNP